MLMKLLRTQLTWHSIDLSKMNKNGREWILKDLLSLLEMGCLHQEGRVIFGLWFHDSNERLRAFECIQSIIKNKNQTPALRRVDISSILSSSTTSTISNPTIPNERPIITDQSMANALTKSSQLLALLKRTASEEKRTASPPQSQSSAAENNNSNTSDVADLKTPSSSADATAKLKSVLFTSPKVASVVATTSETKESRPDDSTIDNRGQRLLAFVKGNSSDKNQPSGRASEASSGAELMTDGDISRKLQALIAKPATPSTQPPKVADSLRSLPTASISSPSTPLTAVSSIQLAAKTPPKLSNALNDLRLSPSSLFEPSVLIGSESIKTAKKPSITLISPSDLGAF
eukprot:scaffold644_cov168-Ochromonas_danica.AAC.1